MTVVFTNVHTEAETYFTQKRYINKDINILHKKRYKTLNAELDS